MGLNAREQVSRFIHTNLLDSRQNTNQQQQSDTWQIVIVDIVNFVVPFRGESDRACIYSGRPDVLSHL